MSIIMVAEKTLPNYGRELAAWSIPMYERYERGTWWYITFFGLAGILILMSFLTPNFLFDKPNYLFAIIILLACFVFIASSFSEPPEADVIIATDGVVVDDRFYSYDSLRDFCVLYKPNEDIKALYFEFKNPILPRLSLSLADQNPIAIRQILSRYLQEDLERTDEPNTDFLAKKLKL